MEDDYQFPSLAQLAGQKPTTSSEETPVEEPRGEASFTDYIKDILWNGPARGVGTAVKGIGKFIADPIDYAFNTNLSSYIDELYKQNFFKLPETKTGVGDFVSLLTEYGLPFETALNIASKVSSLSKFSKMTRLETIPTLAGKANEITKRVGYFGAMSGLTDVVVSSPGENQTFGEQFGLYPGYEGEDLTGRSKAEQELIQKFRFGAEGTLLGGAIPLLPVAGTLGFKYGLVPAGKVLAPVAGGAIRLIDYSVLNPIKNAITYENGIPKLLRKVGIGEEEVTVESLQAQRDAAKSEAKKIYLDTIDQSKVLREKLFDVSTKRGQEQLDAINDLNKEYNLNLKTIDQSEINDIIKNWQNSNTKNSIDKLTSLDQQLEKLKSKSSNVSRIITPSEQGPLGSLVNSAINLYKQYIVPSITKNYGTTTEAANMITAHEQEIQIIREKASRIQQEIDGIYNKTINKQFELFDRGNSSNILSLEQQKLQDYYNTIGDVKITPTFRKATPEELENLKKQLDIIEKTKDKAMDQALLEADKEIRSKGLNLSPEELDEQIKILAENKFSRYEDHVKEIKDNIKNSRIKENKYTYAETKTTEEILNNLHPDLQKEGIPDLAKQLKQKLFELQIELQKLSVNPRDFNNASMQWMTASDKQSLSAMKNKWFNFDPVKEERVVNFIKNETILQNLPFREQLVKNLGNIPDDLIKTKPISINAPTEQIISRLPSDLSIPSFAEQVKADAQIAAKSTRPKTWEDVFQRLRSVDLDNGINDFIKVKNQEDLNALNKEYGLNLSLEDINKVNIELDKMARDKLTSYKTSLIVSQKDPEYAFRKFSEMIGKGKEYNTLTKIRQSVIESNGGITEDIINKISKENGLNELIDADKTGRNLDELNQKYNLELTPNHIKQFNRQLNKIAESKGLTFEEVLNDPKLVKKLVNNLPQTDLASIVEYLSVPKGSQMTVDGKIINIPKVEAPGILNVISHTAEQISNIKMYNQLEKLGLENGWLITQEEALNRGITVPNVQYKKVVAPMEVRGSAVNNIGLFTNGYYAVPEITNALNRNVLAFSSLNKVPFFNEFLKLKYTGSMSATLLSPSAQIRNAGISNALMFFRTGGVGDLPLSDWFKIIFDGKANQAKFYDGLKYNIFNQTMPIREYENIIKMAHDGSILNKILNNDYFVKLKKAYGGADNAWRGAAWEFFQDAFSKSFGDPAVAELALKEGKPELANKIFDEVKDWFRRVRKEKFDEINIITQQPKTPTEAIKEAAAIMTNDTFVPYSQMPKIVKSLAQIPFGNFASFPFGVMLMSANGVLTGARALTSSNPYIRQMGANSLIGTLTLFGTLGETMKLAAQSLTGTSKETVDAYQRSFAPSYEKNSELIPISKPDANGNFKYINFSYSNPFSVVVRPITSILNAFSDGSLNKDSVDTMVMNGLFGNPQTGRVGAIPELLEPFTTESIGTKGFLDVVFRNGKKQNGSYVWFPQDSTNVKIAKSLENVAENLTPGAVNVTKKLWQGATGTFTDSGTQRDATSELISLMSGVKFQEAKPLASLPFMITSYNKDNQQINSKFSSVAYSPNASSEDRLAAYKEYIKESFDSQNKFFRTIQDGMAMGIDQDDLKNLIQSRIFNKQEVQDLFNSTFSVPKVNEKAFKGLIDRLGREDPIAAIKIETQLDTIKDIYKDMSLDLKGVDLNMPTANFEKMLDRLLTPSVNLIRRSSRQQPINFLGSANPSQGNNVPANVAPINSATPVAPVTVNKPTYTAPVTVSPQVIRPSTPVQGLQNEQARARAYFPNDKILGS
jgi:hypothetical protein